MAVYPQNNGENWKSGLPVDFLSMWLPSKVQNLSQSIPSMTDIPHPKKSVVAMIFLPPDESLASREARIILTRRSIKVGSHKGQIGFPGGRVDFGEENDPRRTAIRELNEELGIMPESLSFLGSLPLTSSLDGSPVLPLVAAANIKGGDLKANPDEVAEVILPNWTSLSAIQNTPFNFNIFGQWRKSDLFSLPHNPVWGLTARILADAALG